jgi:hypothetical protein
MTCSVQQAAAGVVPVMLQFAAAINSLGLEEAINTAAAKHVWHLSLLCGWPSLMTLAALPLVCCFFPSLAAVAAQLLINRNGANLIANLCRPYKQVAEQCAYICM